MSPDKKAMISGMLAQNLPHQTIAIVAQVS